MLDPDRRNLIHADELSRCHTAMASDDCVLLINQNWIGEAKGTNAVGNLSDLVFGVSSGVVRVSFQ